jgi:hypothetical protein
MTKGQGQLHKSLQLNGVGARALELLPKQRIAEVRKRAEVLAGPPLFLLGLSPTAKLRQHPGDVGLLERCRGIEGADRCQLVGWHPVGLPHHHDHRIRLQPRHQAVGGLPLLVLQQSNRSCHTCLQLSHGSAHDAASRATSAGGRGVGGRSGERGPGRLVTTLRRLRKAINLRTHKSLADKGTAVVYLERTMGPLSNFGTQWLEVEC